MSLARRIQRRQSKSNAPGKHRILTEKVLNECFLARCIPVRIHFLKEAVCDLPVEHEAVLCPAADVAKPIKSSAFAVITKVIPCTDKALVTGLVNIVITYTPVRCRQTGNSDRKTTLFTPAPFTCCIDLPGTSPNSICTARAVVECQSVQLVQGGRRSQFAACVKVTACIELPKVLTSRSRQVYQPPQTGEI